MFVCALLGSFLIAANVWNASKSSQTVHHVRRIVVRWNALPAGVVHTRRMLPHVRYVILQYWDATHVRISHHVRVVYKNIFSIKVVISAWTAPPTVAPVVTQPDVMFAILDITKMVRFVKFARWIVWNVSAVLPVLYARRDIISLLILRSRRLVSLARKVVFSAVSKMLVRNVWKITILTDSLRNAQNVVILRIVRLAIFRDSVLNAHQKSTFWVWENASLVELLTIIVTHVCNRRIIVLSVMINFTQPVENAYPVVSWSRDVTIAHRRTAVLHACPTDICSMLLPINAIVARMSFLSVIYAR